MRATLSSVSGQVLHEEESAERRSVGTYRVGIDTQGLPSGVYVFQLQAGSDSASLKVVKK